MTATTVREGDAIVRVRGLSKTYARGLVGRGGFRALDDVTLSVPRASVFGLLGPNGAGKTTLIKVLLGLVRGYRGEASLFGLPPGDPASRRRVGYLPEAHRLPVPVRGRVLDVVADRHGAARPVFGRSDQARSSSTSNSSVAFGGMTPPAPRAP